ncbi:MAG TPA: hypothetical protein VFX43_02865 [Chitinophagaceae bacterium]|nr:hypothetical protein [Chitinophagaceae bacterium]
MTSIAIQEQVDAIRKATTKASRTKKAAIAFLDAAGIVSTPVKKNQLKRKNKRFCHYTIQSA